MLYYFKKGQLATEMEKKKKKAFEQNGLFRV